MQTPKILIVEDNPDMALALSMPLDAQGYRVSVASTGPEGLQMILDLQPDLIILDVTMETCAAGCQVSLVLRDPDPESVFAPYRQTPILMLTAAETAASLRCGPDEACLPVDDFVTKPVDPDVLLDRVRVLLAC